MQKLLRRSALVQRQAIRKANVKRKVQASDSRKLREREELQVSALVRRDVHEERKARREDWVQGPLAPKRDVGEPGKTYGALETRRIRGVDKAKFKKWGIVQGDRVVVVKEGHKDRGKIGKVTEVRVKAEECIVEGLNMVCGDFAGEKVLGANGYLIGRYCDARFHAPQRSRQNTISTF